MAPFGVMELSSDQIGEPSSVTIAERDWQLLEANGITPGSQISISLDGLPQRSLWQKLKDSLSSIRFEYVAPITLVMLMVGLAAFALWRRQREEIPVILSSEASEESVASQERQVILQMLRELEQRFRTGEVKEEDYSRRRRVLNSRLVSLPRG